MPKPDHSFSRLRAPRLLVAFLLSTGVATFHPAARVLASSAENPQTSGKISSLSSSPGQKVTLRPVAAGSADTPFDADLPAEQRLLELANQSRQQVGATPLTLDPGLSQAARLHAQAMLAARQLSHQFDGEPSLPQRLADATRAQLDQEGENVALDYDADQGHDHLMLSPPHRANLLNPAYNVVGLGVVRSGDRLYIVQDFGRSLPAYSSGEMKQRIVAAVNDLRRQSKQSDLQLRDSSATDDAACSMAQADKLVTASIRNLAQHSTVLSYTSLRPQTLPAEAPRAIGNRALHTVSIGACYGRTDTYPTGVYWVVLALE